MKKKFFAAAFAAALVVLSACGDAGSGSDSVSQAPVSEAKKEATMEMDTEAVETLSESTSTEDTVSSGTAEDAGTGGSVQAVDRSRKLIRYEDYSIETKEFDEFVEALNKLVSETGGYIEYSEVSGNDYGNTGNRYASYTLRIPVKELDGFQSKIQDMGNLVRQSERVEDVTLNYVDTESHITALKAEQESLIALLEKAEDLEAVIALQNRLTEVRYQLESYESQIRTYDNAIEYSTVSLYLNEVERETKTSETFTQKLSQRFSDSLYGVKNAASAFVLWFLGGIPYWVVLAVLIFVITRCVKKIRRRTKKGTETEKWKLFKKKKKTEEENE